MMQIAQHRPGKGMPLRVLIDLTTLEKCGRFLHLSTPTDDPDHPDPWVRILNGKRGLHLVVLYLECGHWRIPWSFRVWRGKGHPSPSHLACKLLATVPINFTQGRRVIVLADTEFGSGDFLNALRQQAWRAVVGMRCTRQLQDGRSLKQLYRKGKRGQQVYLKGIRYPLLLVLAQTSRWKT
jgi:hypothetical protein